ncbi:hypothetical protein BJ684DRAFT_16549 [Piptocephalis cylindrospora]|uniref:RNase H type-1 domain-containing protein n=1 Tax=Piptocephalis cylindrospora TaxID=1907219 RepID=A0A4P9Y324_9FUNG|nr:hypothetical protein BJ684DRAFT_16549 [Piptocephalis cylindrospora]|eukprot:RKP13012.1 hypothetical protein BJ684DRAFT_16549 [Piptocephalis cylindrospora]
MAFLKDIRTGLAYQYEQAKEVRRNAISKPLGPPALRENPAMGLYREGLDRIAAEQQRIHHLHIRSTGQEPRPLNSPPLTSSIGLKVGGALAHRLEAWLALSKNPWVMEIIRQGFTIPWDLVPTKNIDPGSTIPRGSDQGHRSGGLRSHGQGGHREVQPSTPDRYTADSSDQEGRGLSRGITELLRFPAERNDLPFLHFPFWPVVRPFGIYQDATPVGPEGRNARNTTGGLHGRHFDHGIIKESGRDAYAAGGDHVDLPGLDNSPPQELFYTLTNCALKLPGVKIRGIWNLSEKALRKGEIAQKTLPLCNKNRGKRAAEGNYPVPFPQDMRSELQRWAQTMESWNGKALLTTTPQEALETNASDVGWDEYYQVQVVQGKWCQDEKRLHINAQELRAVAKAIEALHLQGKHFALKSDNISTMTVMMM